MIDARTFGVLSQQRIREELPHIDPRLNTVLVQLNRTSANLISAFEAKVHRDLDISWAGYRLLFVLWVMGEVEPARAAELTHASRASVSTLSASFVTRGLVTRRPSTKDRRSVVLTLTEEGRQFVLKAVEKQEDAQREILADLTAEEQEILSILLNKVSCAQLRNDCSDL